MKEGRREERREGERRGDKEEGKREEEGKEGGGRERGRRKGERKKKVRRKGERKKLVRRRERGNEDRIATTKQQGMRDKIARTAHSKQVHLMEHNSSSIDDVNLCAHCIPTCQHITIAARYQEDFRAAVVHVHIGFEDFIVEGWSEEAPVPSPLGSIGYQQTIAW